MIIGTIVADSIMSSAVTQGSILVSMRFKMPPLFRSNNSICFPQKIRTFNLWNTLATKKRSERFGSTQVDFVAGS